VDTGVDFIRPEFLNILFFQQKNLVVFPYVDLRHLHALEIFTAGYNMVDLESTALHNLKEILEFEATNSYSQNPTLYFIYNVDREKVKELINLEGIRCIINSNENVSSLANGRSFIFFNKKSNQFLNYDIDESELELENNLIKDSQDEEILQEKIQKIKIAATRIFKELNKAGNLKNLPDILAEYDKKYWKSILDFTSRYYDINIPDISSIKFKPRKTLKDYSNEYEVLISTNRALGKEFIQLLHEYRSKKVNPAHLELDELYNPQKLYNYLRNHHWKDGIPEDFIHEWREMNISNYQLTEEDQSDFTDILIKLGLEVGTHNSFYIKPSSLPVIEVETPEKSTFTIPSVKTEWDKFRKWILARLQDLEHLSGNNSMTSKILSYSLDEISELLRLLGNHKDGIDEMTHQAIPEPIREEIIAGMKKLNIEECVELYEIDNKVEFAIDFIVYLSNLHDDVFGVDNSIEIGIPIKIKNFNFPQNHERELLRFNRIRSRLVAHRKKKLTRKERDNILKNNEKRLNNTYLDLLAYLLRSQVRHIARKYNFTDIPKINQFVITKYIKNTIFSQQEINKILEFLD